MSGSANSDRLVPEGRHVPDSDGCRSSGLGGQAIVATQFGKAKKFADLYCAEIAACKQADPILKGVTDKAGIGFTSIAISSTAPSYQAECLELKNQEVDYAQLNFSTDAAAKFVQDCQQQGYNPTWGSSEQAAGAAFKSLKNFTMFGPAYAFPSVAKNPEVKKFRDAMTKYAKGKDWAEGTGSFTWGGLELLHKQLGTITTGDPTPGDRPRGDELGQRRGSERVVAQQAHVHGPAGRIRQGPVLLRGGHEGWEGDRPEPAHAGVPARHGVTGTGPGRSYHEDRPEDRPEVR